MSGIPRITKLVSGIPAMVPFVGPEAQERARGRPFRARIGANESAFGPSPRAIEAMRMAAAEQWKYADPESHDLRAGVAAFHGIAPENVVIGEGIDGLLGLAVKIAAEPGATVVTSDGAYPTFKFHVAANGSRLVKVPYRDDREDLDALLAAAKANDAHVLYVSNPDNPMGSWWPAADIERLIARLPDGCLLLLDEAYGDTAPAGTLPAIDVTNSQVLRLRTFSKAYGLAGARIGYAVGEASLVAEFEKVRNHYGINRAGQIGALAALEDQAYLKIAVAAIARARERIAQIARDNGLTPLPSATNFVTIDCSPARLASCRWHVSDMTGNRSATLSDGRFAKCVLEGLLARDVFARKPGIAPLDRCIRISCGTDADLDVLAAELPLALAEACAAS
jgi:histidinol-phosphate aminotransferase